MRQFVLAVAVVFLWGSSAYARPSEPSPKISMSEARQKALHQAPGKIQSQELEQEGGRLIYSFDIRTKTGGTTEVNIDAMDGKVVAVQQESPARERAEKRQEKHQDRHGRTPAGQ